jgi:Fe-S-cluster containining protein
MPQINYSEFVQIATRVWKEKSHAEILDIICTSLEYFFRYDYGKWGQDALVKPCMLLNEDGMCTVYEDRPLSCRMYGIWPEDMYNERVDKFAESYKEKYGLKREELPLAKQCPLVTRKSEDSPLTREVIEGLYKQLDELDKTTGDFSDVQVRQKENYRTFHDWLLLKILGEDWLSQLTAFILAADRETMEDQIVALKDVIRDNFKDKLPDITKTL